MKSIFFTLLFSCASSLAAQTGQLQGRISTVDEKALPGAGIALCKEDDQLLAYTESDSSGNYRFCHVAEGFYHIECSAPYFTSVRSFGISVENDVITEKDIRMFLPSRDLASALVATEKGETTGTRCRGGAVIIDGIKIRNSRYLPVSEKLDNLVHLPGTPADADMVTPLPPFRTADPRYFSPIRSH
ncbi:MAG: carboxypeptidase-like regulatory domain-containing protein [Flavobacteriales bacterium]